MIITSNLSSPTSKGPISHYFNNIYDYDQKVFSRKYLTYGTSLGLILNNMELSVCEQLDKSIGVEDSGWANTNLISAMHYCNILQYRMLRRQINDNNCLKRGSFDKLFKPKNVHWMELFTSLIIFYKREDVEKLISKGLAKYHELAKDSPSFGTIFKNPNEFLGEYQIIRSQNNPKPPLMIVGYPLIKLDKGFVEKRMPMLLNQLQLKYKGATIIYFKNYKLVASKSTKETGVGRRSFEGARLLEYLNSTKWY